MNEWRYSHEITIGCKKSVTVKYYYNKEAKVKKIYSTGKEEIIDKISKGPHGERIYVTIAKLFPEICGQWFEGCQVDHINCDRNDNRAENLRCCTGKENMRNPLTRQHCIEAMYKRIEDGVYDNMPEKLKSHIPWNKGMKGQYKIGPQSKEHRRKLSEAAKNRPPISEETRRKQSEAHKNNPTKYWLGKNLPEEMRQKISNTLNNKNKEL